MRFESPALSAPVGRAFLSASRCRKWSAAVIAALAIGALLDPAPAAAALGDVTHLAGNGTSGHTGDGGAATSASISVGGVAVDGRGNLFITNNTSHTVRRVDAATGVITTIAGQPGVASPFGYTGGDGIPATQTTFLYPTGITIDAYGNLYIGENQGVRIRRIDAWTGIVNTVAGTGAFGSTQEGAVANQTSVFYVPAVAQNKQGDLFFPDIGAMGVWKVDAATRRINSVVLDASIFWFPDEVATDRVGNVYVNSRPSFGSTTHRVYRISPAGTIDLLVESAGFGGMAVDAVGNVFYVENGTNAVLKRAASGGTSTVATLPVTAGSGSRMEADAAGNVYVSTGSRVYRIEGIATPADGTCTP